MRAWLEYPGGRQPRLAHPPGHEDIFIDDPAFWGEQSPPNLRDLEDDRQLIDIDAHVLLHSLAGVPRDPTLAEPPSFASICEPDLEGSFVDLAATAGTWLAPLCLPNCAADLDRDTPELDVSCEVSAFSITADLSTTVPACMPAADGWSAPAGSPRCFITHTGAALDPRCAAEGFNLEFELIRTAPDPADIYYSAGCALSRDKTHDCPEL